MPDEITLDEREVIKGNHGALQRLQDVIDDTGQAKLNDAATISRQVGSAF
jgi:hypothetical protein